MAIGNANRDTGVKVIAAENTFSDAVDLKKGKFDVSISASTPGAGFTATVTLQRRFEATDNGFKDTTDNYTVETEDILEIGSAGTYRIGVKTGNYTSGTIHARLRQD